MIIKGLLRGMKRMGAYLVLLALSASISAGCTEQKNEGSTLPSEKTAISPLPQPAPEGTKREVTQDEPKAVDVQSPGVPVDAKTYREMKEKAGSER